MEHRVMPFFWGVCLLTSGWLLCASKASVSENLDESISALKKFYGEKNGDLHNGHPVFLQILKDLKVNFEEHEQKLLMSFIIETYSRIFSRMQTESEDEVVRERLEHVLEHLRKLQENYFPGKSSELKSYAELLWAIKDNDPMVQRKALHELRKVYREATQLKNMNTDHRRRKTNSLKRPRKS